MTARIMGMAAVAIVLAATGPAVAGLPGCNKITEVSGDKVVRVENDGAVVLADGRAVMPEGLLLPQGSSDRAARFYAREAIDAMRALAVNQRVTVTLERPKEDRYGRIRGQIYFAHEHGGVWLQGQLLRQGLARVAISPDRPECAGDLLAAERDGRLARAGLWSSPAYAVKTPGGLKGTTGSYQIVEGTVKGVAVKNGRAYLNFGDDWRRDFTVTVAPTDLARFKSLGGNPARYAGWRVRVRGWIENLNGPEMEIAVPQAIEVLGPTEAAAAAQAAAGK